MRYNHPAKRSCDINYVCLTSLTHGGCVCMVTKTDQANKGKEGREAHQKGVLLFS